MQPAREWVLRVFDGTHRLTEFAGEWPDALLEAEGWQVRASAEGDTVRAEVLRQGSGGISLGIRFLVPPESLGTLCFPGAVYSGNRFRMRPLEYPCILREAEDLGVGVPVTTALLPGLPKFQLLARDGAAPALGWHGPHGGVWIAFDERTNWGPTGIEADETCGSATIWFPGVREGTVYGGQASPDRAFVAPLGSRLNARLSVTRTAGQPEWEACLLRHWKAFWIRDNVEDLPFSSAQRLLVAKHNELYWNETEGYFMLSDGSWEYGCWQAGWVGGGIQMFGLAHEEDPLTRPRVDRMLDFVCGPAQHPSGLFWSVGRNGVFDTDMVGMEWGHDWHLVRRSGDVAHFLARTLRLKQALGHPIAATWTLGLRHAVEALWAIFERQGQFGMFVAQDTGEIRSGDTTSGAIIPAAFVEASLALGEPEWVGRAGRAADALVALFERQGFTNGGPGEAAQAPDSESAFALLESLVLLGEATGDPERWSQAERAAAHAATWVMPYDYRFPAASTLGRAGIRTGGSVWANAQNKHSAPGICTLSGQSLLRLYRQTGQPIYLDLLKSIARGVTQYLSRPDRVLFDLPPGGSCERVNTCDWEAPHTPIGEGFAVDCWSSISALLTACEIPGVYVDISRRRAVAFDHVRLDVDWDRSELHVHNPTTFAAEVSILVERTLPAPADWSPLTVVSAPRVQLAPGASTTVSFAP